MKDKKELLHQLKNIFNSDYLTNEEKRDILHLIVNGQMSLDKANKLFKKYIVAKIKAGAKNA